MAVVLAQIRNEPKALDLDHIVPQVCFKYRNNTARDLSVTLSSLQHSMPDPRKEVKSFKFKCRPILMYSENVT
jgi:hypothetical protein